MTYDPSKSLSRNFFLNFIILSLAQSSTIMAAV